MGTVIMSDNQLINCVSIQLDQISNNLEQTKNNNEQSSNTICEISGDVTNNIINNIYELYSYKFNNICDKINNIHDLLNKLDKLHNFEKEYNNRFNELTYNISNLIEFDQSQNNNNN